jgi:hypothetical protein
VRHTPVEDERLPLIDPFTGSARTPTAPQPKPAGTVGRRRLR